ncbi:hypothetical protein OUZ56_022809 [Daphnia magna]|uniref:Uncharacterized protein n=1 Tax=Daphnia magna TaxID=35525 RepID=A0ABR0AXN6_9CRUS|nr:hypothetical protein OUZ56_022809 [Daphnia magna]
MNERNMKSDLRIKVIEGNEEDVGRAFSLLPRRCLIQAGGHEKPFEAFDWTGGGFFYPPMVEAKMTPNTAKHIMIIIFFCKYPQHA